VPVSAISFIELSTKAVRFAVAVSALAVSVFNSPNTPFAFTGKDGEKKKAKRQADLTGYTPVNENRWLALKQDESTAQSKIGRGISNINKQLREMERFLNWYGKIKNESGVSNKSYWKRTNSHIYSIQERLLKLDQKIRQISE
jgi:hypothetical protein